MRHSISFLALVLGAALLGGCGRDTGWLIRPVPVTEELQEREVLREPGWLVRDKIVIIDVEGLMMNQRSPSIFGEGENPVSFFVEKVDKAQSDPDVKALIIRINSPGGGVTASDIMYQRLMRFRQARGVPVVAVIQDVGASGGYYLACAADVIVAHPTAVTGSIGVIIQTVSFAGTMQKLGIDAKAVTSGQYKDMGSFLKPIEEGDLRILQAMALEFHERFIDVIRLGRPELEEQRIRDLADGRVYTGRQAQEVGLVDSLGYMQEALVAAKSLSEAQRVRVVMYTRPWGYKSSVYSAAATPPAQVNLVNIAVPDFFLPRGPQLMYLWAGQGLSEE